MSIVLLVLRRGRLVRVVALFAQRARLMTRRIRRFHLGLVLSHAYIWLCLIVFVTPFVVLLGHALDAAARRDRPSTTSST